MVSNAPWRNQKRPRALAIRATSISPETEVASQKTAALFSLSVFCWFMGMIHDESATKVVTNCRQPGFGKRRCTWFGLTKTCKKLDDAICRHGGGPGVQGGCFEGSHIHHHVGRVSNDQSTSRRVPALRADHHFCNWHVPTKTSHTKSNLSLIGSTAQQKAVRKNVKAQT